jgi:hypothetical protein
MTRIGAKKSLVYKIGIEEGFRISIINPPDGYLQALGRLPKNVVEEDRPTVDMDLIQVFSGSRRELDAAAPSYARALKSDGIIWLCWPKESSNIRSDLNGIKVREIGVANGLTYVKVSSIDDRWQGLKFERRAAEKA